MTQSDFQPYWERRRDAVDWQQSMKQLVISLATWWAPCPTWPVLGYVTFKSRLTRYITRLLPLRYYLVRTTWRGVGRRGLWIYLKTNEDDDCKDIIVFCSCFMPPILNNGLYNPFHTSRQMSMLGHRDMKWRLNGYHQSSAKHLLRIFPIAVGHRSKMLKLSFCCGISVDGLQLLHTFVLAYINCHSFVGHVDTSTSMSYWCLHKIRHYRAVCSLIPSCCPSPKPDKVFPTCVKTSDMNNLLLSAACVNKQMWTISWFDSLDIAWSSYVKGASETRRERKLTLTKKN